jgi:epoxyqueuosine reductase
MQPEQDSPKPKLLLHSCCAPCSVYIAPELSRDYEVTCFFYNPNIDNPEEYVKRKEEMESLSEKKDISLVIGEYDREKWKLRVKGLENAPEGGERCIQCFNLRLEKTAEMAEKLGYGAFATTLTIAPMKNHETVNMEGQKAADGRTVEYMSSNFKKNDGYRKSADMSKEMGLYRQNYCGCSFSMPE